VDTDTLVVIIEQFLMLILIIGRWMLPKGDLTRCLAIDTRETLLELMLVQLTSLYQLVV